MNSNGRIVKTHSVTIILGPLLSAMIVNGDGAERYEGDNGVEAIHKLDKALQKYHAESA